MGWRIPSSIYPAANIAAAYVTDRIFTGKTRAIAVLVTGVLFRVEDFMQETEEILRLFRGALRDREQMYLATVVYVQGSSYRKPGACMLVTSSGKRAGHISGGCLEAEVSHRIAWLTREGSTLLSYSSSFDDDNEGVPYGLGCGGTVWILMERGDPVRATILALEQSFRHGQSSVLTICLNAATLGTAAILTEDCEGFRRTQVSDFDVLAGCPWIDESAAAARVRTKTTSSAQQTDTGLPQFVFIPLAPPPDVVVFGAGDDAQSLVRLMGFLGWRVKVADGRGHLVTKERFPESSSLCRLKFAATQDGCQSDLTINNNLEVKQQDFAVILTHSYAQDRAVLKYLLPKELAYLGILGPLHRTERLVKSLVPVVEKSFETCMSALHAPVGLQLGSDHPNMIALSIVSEMQAVMTGTTGILERERSLSSAIEGH